MANKELRDKREVEDKRRESADLLFAYAHPGHIFEHEGWDVRWLGWRTPLDAIYEFGVWLATRVDDNGFYAATTMGSCRYYKTHQHRLVLDATPGYMSVFFTDEERVLAMGRAGKELLACIKRGHDARLSEHLDQHR